MSQEHSQPSSGRLAFLSLLALGVVYGDIGTSPLYAMRQCFDVKEYGLAVTQANVYGVLSLIVWLLILVVAVKYIVFIMKADNRGEGGILALLALILQQTRRDDERRRRWLLISLGLFGAALLYGDGIITPAITVLGAAEGLQVRSTMITQNMVVIISVVILLVLFSVQRFGTSRVGAAFGPIMLVWFIVIAALGTMEILREPEILKAINPWWGVDFFRRNDGVGFLTLGGVVLVVTGAEALYADMGHFGRHPIQLAWFALVLPALLLNYFGQGALLLRDASAASNPFYRLAPEPVLVPLLILATAAAIVASQALISGAYSLARQSMQLGYSPRMEIIHTSKREAGQIYIPEINTALAVGCVVLVLIFQGSTALGAAYGIAVTGTMAITSLLFYVVARTRWGWSIAKIAPLTAIFLIVDAMLFSANFVKVERGGWVPLAVAIAVFTLMSTWKKGRDLLNAALRGGALPLDLFLDDVRRSKPTRVAGTAVFMTSTPEGVPLVLLHHLKHNKVLHEQVILMSVITEEVPDIPADERLQVDTLGEGFFRISARYGFMETPRVPAILDMARESGLKARATDTTFYLGRERIIIGRGREVQPGSRVPNAAEELPRMARWRKKLFVIMSRNARSATEFFGIPPNRVVELGAQVEV